MKKIIIILLTFILAIVFLLLNILSKKTQNTPPASQIQSEPISCLNFMSTDIEELIIEPNMTEENPEIYGYDENALQIKKSYNGYEASGYIEIPKTDVSLPILSNVTVQGMEYSCCILYSTGELNQNGNTFIIGHNRDNDQLFSNNKNLKIGDKIIITGLQKNRLEYTIYNIFNTTPSDTSYLTKPIDDNRIEITLQTCNNDKEDTRLIIEAYHEIQ